MWVFAPFVFFSGAVVAHAITCRLPMRTDFVAKSVLVGVPIGLALGIWLFGRYHFGIETCAALLMYGFMMELYIFCFTLVSTSVSVSILLAVFERPLETAEIDERYSDSSMVEGRMEKLLRAGFLARGSGGFRVTGKARVVLFCFRTLRFFFRHPDSTL